MTYSLLSVLVLVLVLFASSGAAWATTFSNPVDADYGHITNSVYLSRADFPDGAAAAVLAGSESYADSLTATVLAKAADGPLLLTSSTSLSTSVRDELVRLKVTKVFIVGLSTTIVSAVKTALPKLASGQIVALAGTDRYQTAALVAGKVKELAGATPARAFIVPGDVYGSSLAAAAVAAANGWPILLTPAAGPFPAASAQAIVSLGIKTGVRVDTSVNPGVSGFTVEKTVVGTTSTTDDPGARYTEALAMAEYAVQQGWATYAHVALGEEQGGSVAYSENFPDNVLLASHIAREGGAYLLSRSTALHSNVVTLLKAHGKEIDSVDFARPDYDQALSGAWSFGTIRQVKSLNSPRVTGLSKTSGSLGGGGALTVTGSGFTGATTVRIGKTDLPAGSWKVNSDTSITIDALPPAPQPEAAEILVSNHWYVSPSSPSDVYFYVSDTWPEPAAMKVVREAVKYLGTPYVWAGASTSGFDCSGFTMYVYNKFTSLTGVTLPRKSTYQANYGTPVDVEDLLPGDLVFFYSPISHVGIYVGGGLMINSPRSGDLVTIEDVYRTSYTTARRLIAPAYAKVEDTSTLLAYSGTWGTTPTSSASGGSYAYSDANGASVTVTFDGIYLQWLAKKSTAFGLATVSVDGTPAGTVNLYSSTTLYKQKVWDTGVLPQGTHTVTITRTGTSGGGGTNIGLDAFEVIGTPVEGNPVPIATRYQETDSRIVWTGAWTLESRTGHSGGSLSYANAVASVVIRFNGTYIGWIARTSPSYGIAAVFVDGVAQGTVDLYSGVGAYQALVWHATLGAGDHVVRIEWTGTKRAAATSTYINLDAFDILGTILQNSAPSVTGLNPASGTTAGGTSVVITGTGFTGATAVTFGGAPATGVAINSAGTQITAVSPAHAAGTNLQVQVITPNGASADVAADNYTYVAPGGLPTITGLNPTSGTTAGGTSVVITGTGLTGASGVTFGGVAATGYLVDSDTQITAVSPAHSAGANLQVQVGAPSGSTANTAADNYTYVVPSASTRYDQINGNIVKTGVWEDFPKTEAYLGSYGRSSTAGATATIYFSGTKIAWIGMKGTTTGMVDVYLDSTTTKTTTIDLTATTATYQVTLWTSPTLTNTTHYLRLVRSTSSATGKFMTLDAVDIWGSIKAGP